MPTRHRTRLRTIADLPVHAATEHAQRAALRYQQDGAWRDVTYAELADDVRDVALGLVAAARMQTRSPGAAQEILEFFYACGVTVLEGYGMTETAAAITTSTLAHHRFGTVGRALPGTEIRTADDTELLVRGPNVFSGYHGDAVATASAIVDGWLHTGDLGTIDGDGYVTITGRKKDIIITSGGKNITPALIENALRQSRWVSQVVTYGDRRPYLVAIIALDRDEVRAFAREHGLEDDIAALSRDPQVHALVPDVVNDVNTRFAPVEQIKRFHILDHDFSHDTGELTPTLKLKRRVVCDRYAKMLDALYD